MPTFIQGLNQEWQFVGAILLAAVVAYAIGAPLAWLAIKFGARLPRDSAKSRFKSRLLERRVIPFDETRRQALRHGLATGSQVRR